MRGDARPSARSAPSCALLMLASATLLGGMSCRPDSLPAAASPPAVTAFECDSQGRRFMLSSGKGCRLVMTDKGGVATVPEGKCLALSPDGKRAAFLMYTDSGLVVWLYDLDAGCWLPAPPLPPRVVSLAWAPDGRQMAACAMLDHERYAVLLADGDGNSPQTLARHSSSVQRLRWDPDGKAVYYAARNEPPAGQRSVIRLFAANGAITAVAWAPQWIQGWPCGPGGDIALMRITGQYPDGREATSLSLLRGAPPEEIAVQTGSLQLSDGRFDCSPRGDALLLHDAQGAARHVAIPSGKATPLEPGARHPRWVTGRPGAFVYLRPLPGSNGSRLEIVCKESLDAEARVVCTADIERSAHR